MSTRWYPLYQKGNPQLRVFLPNFWMKLVKPKFSQPPNVVKFKVSMEMTKRDVRNYLEKIYKIPVVEVRTQIELGPTKREPLKGYIVKDEDVKVAYVVLVNYQLLHESFLPITNLLDNLSHYIVMSPVHIMPYYIY
ncbi:39S ribosomal protein L23, mitochondrial isoform X2 [Ischnura elegans]|uniref:39S ribosomal protein L23, mitochondrial isoform X2 n=1 Tax=Ischnura elegans TaxID=197161 RepID=UPI001ED8671D|nr:39S ribosomal protein L23, mitochondrial isoform X2 [Ischnura elegans]